jgi:fatty acyl-CoA reductase
MFGEGVSQFPSKKMIWMPSLKIVRSEFMFLVFFGLYHYLPAFFIDIGLSLKGTKFRLTTTYNKIFYHLRLYSFFTGNTWKFSDENMQKLYLTMSDKDHQDFPCTLKREDYEPLAVSSMNGLRKHFLKESDKDLLESRRKLKVLKMFRYLYFAILCIFLVYFMYTQMIKVMMVHLN